MDPTQLFLCQFEAVRKLLGNDSAHVLPLGMGQLPALKAFDPSFRWACFPSPFTAGASLAVERSTGE
ncbi:DUF1698 domain-containing protein [Shigella flexneri]